MAQCFCRQESTFFSVRAPVVSNFFDDIQMMDVKIVCVFVCFGRSCLHFSGYVAQAACDGFYG